MTKKHWGKIWLLGAALLGSCEEASEVSGEAAGSPSAGMYLFKYRVDLNARGPQGPLAPTFVSPANGQTVSYELLSLQYIPRVETQGHCWKIGATRHDTEAVDQQIWFEEQPGMWRSLANDTINGLDPAALVYSELQDYFSLRVADRISHTPPNKGRFAMNVLAHMVPGETARQTCDRLASSVYPTHPYIRVLANRAVEVVRREGAP